jgi:hypothetical protein
VAGGGLINGESGQRAGPLGQGPADDDGGDVCVLRPPDTFMQV